MLRHLPRLQRILLWALLTGSLVMAASLLYLHDRNARRLAAAAADEEAYPIAAPTDQPSEPVTLELANDADGSLTPVQTTMALPQERNARVRALLERLLSEYAQPQSTHPLAAGPAVDEVFLLALADLHNPEKPTAPPIYSDSGNLMAIINLHGRFADTHPSGIAVESLTLLSIATTLHDNMPGITQVKFLVDGQQRQTLAGHADLTRAYLTSSMAVTPPTGPVGK